MGFSPNSMSPNRPQRNRKRNRLIYYGDDEAPNEQSSKSTEAKHARNSIPSSSIIENDSKSFVSLLPPSDNSTRAPEVGNSNDRVIARKIGIRLKNLLKLPKAHKMCIYEWFYSHIDAPLFKGDNDFLICLRESFQELKTKRLTRSHWSKIRRLIGKPRRCSQVFFTEERNSLQAKRQKIRLLQQRKNTYDNAMTFTDLPKEIPMHLVLGTRVTVRLRGKYDGLFSGRIDAIDVSNSSYRVSLDRQALGTKDTLDIEVASDEPQETMQLSSLTELRRPPHSLVTSVQSDLNDSLQSPTSKHDPILGQSPLRSKFPGGGGTLGGFPVNFLVQVTRLSKILLIKKENIKLLEHMNSQAEKSHSYGEKISLQFQKKYATIILDLERINKDLNRFLLGVQQFCHELSPEHNMIYDQLLHIRQDALQSAELMVCSKNITSSGKCAVKNDGLTSLVTELTAVMLQIKFLKENNANPYEFKSVLDSMNDIKKKLSSGNIESFQDNIEIHIAHIQSGLNNSSKLNRL